MSKAIFAFVAAVAAFVTAGLVSESLAVGLIAGWVIVAWVLLALNGWCPVCNAVIRRLHRKK